MNYATDSYTSIDLDFQNLLFQGFNINTSIYKNQEYYLVNRTKHGCQ